MEKIEVRHEATRSIEKKQLEDMYRPIGVPLRALTKMSFNDYSSRLYITYHWVD